MPDAPSIRPATLAEAPALRAILRAAFALYVERMGREPAPMNQDLDADTPAGKVWLAEGAQGPQGLLVGYGEADGVGWRLETVAVAPQAQGTGLGRALIAFAETEAQRRGFRAVRLYTNARMTENLSMYPRLGYEETGRRREAGFDRVYFEKALG